MYNKNWRSFATRRTLPRPLPTIRREGRRDANKTVQFILLSSLSSKTGRKKTSSPTTFYFLLTTHFVLFFALKDGHGKPEHHHK
jgi:hypothetical protein